MLTSPASSLARGAAAAGAPPPPPPPPTAAAALAAVAPPPPATPWHVASSGSQGRARVLRVAQRGLGRLTRSLASVALDKEASLASGRLTPVRAVVAQEGEGGGGGGSGGGSGSSAAAAAAAARRRGGGGGGGALAAAEARAAAQRGAYLGKESRSRIQGTFSTFSPAASEGVSAVLADKMARQAARGARGPKEALALLMDEAKARGLPVPKLRKVELEEMMEGAAALREAGHARAGSRALPRVWAGARPSPSAAAAAQAARAAAASTPLGVVMDYMEKNREQLVEEARAIAWPGTSRKAPKRSE
jgi:hypothetical protein